MTSLTPVPSDKRWPSKPIFCLSPTTFWTTFPSTKTAAEVEPSAEVLIPRMVPHLVPLLVPDKYLKTHEQDHEHHQQCGRGKKRFVAGSDPLFWRCYHAKIPSDFGGRSRPQCVRLAHELPSYPASAVPKVPARADRRCLHARPRVQPRRKAHASSEAARTCDHIHCLLSLPREEIGTAKNPSRGRPAGAAPSSRP